MNKGSCSTGSCNCSRQSVGVEGERSNIDDGLHGEVAVGPATILVEGDLCCGVHGRLVGLLLGLHGVPADERLATRRGDTAACRSSSKIEGTLSAPPRPRGVERPSS